MGKAQSSLLYIQSNHYCPLLGSRHYYAHLALINLRQVAKTDQQDWLAKLTVGLLFISGGENTSLSPLKNKKNHFENPLLRSKFIYNQIAASDVCCFRRLSF